MSSDLQTERPARTPQAVARHLWAVSVGVVHAAWRLWRHRASDPVIDAAEGTDPAADPERATARPDEQPETKGTGPRFRRRFLMTVNAPTRSAAEVMADAQADPNRIAPDGFASFHKEEGEPGRMAKGDVYLVDLLGPWTNRVRVVDVTPTSFRFAALQGHVEAGHVDISTRDRAGRLEVEVRTRTRSGDRVLDVLYDRVGITRLLQTEMWAQVCEHTAALAGGRPEPLRIDDVRLSDPDDPSR